MTLLHTYSWYLNNSEERIKWCSVINLCICSVYIWLTQYRLFVGGTSTVFTFLSMVLCLSLHLWFVIVCSIILKFTFYIWIQSIKVVFVAFRHHILIWLSKQLRRSYVLFTNGLLKSITLLGVYMYIPKYIHVHA